MTKDWKDALISTAIAIGLGLAVTAAAAVYFNYRLGGVFAAGFKPFIG